MKILIIGGTNFLGRHLTEAALAAGHEVTLFNRGKTNPDLFKGKAELLTGDRRASLAPLANRRWDVAVDVCGYIPREVRMATEALADSVEHYTFVSTISVYSDTTIYNMDESGPLATLDDETIEEVTGETYGGLKVLCEQAAEAGMPGRVLTARSGLIVGPHDPTDRFTYWPVRIQLGGDTLAPGKPEMRVQFIDARDQAAWLLRMAEARKTGIYNVTGPDYPLTMGKVLETCIAVSGSDANLIWANDDFLIEHEIGPFSEMPLWIPETYNGLQAINVQKALDDGLTFRPLADTVRDTLRWNASRGPAQSGPSLRAGLMLDKEADLVAELKGE